MFLTKKAIDRRTVLRGMGATLALPFLDAMAPALSAAGKSPTRFGAVYVPNGVVMDNWTPAAVGTNYAFTPILKPLETFRDRLVVLTGLDSVADQGEGDHPVASTRFLTNVDPNAARGTSQLLAGVSMDQLLAREFGRDTRLASLELGLEGSESAGTCSSDLPCAYVSTIAWSGPTTPLPMEQDPRLVFERLFGDSGSTDPAVRAARARENGSLLDSVNDKLAHLKRRLGAGDHAKIDEYIHSVRDVERRIQMVEATNHQVPTMAMPSGIPGDFKEHARLMYDLFVLAYQVDLTRVVTFMIGREQSGRTFPELGISDSHHPLSHHQDDPAKLAKLTTINTYHVTLFAEFLDKLRSTPDGDGSLLDHSAIIYGSGMSNGNGHVPTDLPIVLAGGGGGRLRTGHHVRYDGKKEQLANLHLTLLHAMGVPVERIGDSTRTFGELTV